MPCVILDENGTPTRFATAEEIAAGGANVWCSPDPEYQAGGLPGTGTNPANIGTGGTGGVPGVEGTQLGARTVEGDNPFGGGDPSIWQRAWGFIKDHPELLLAGSLAFLDARRQGRSDDYRDRAVGVAEHEAAKRSAIQAMLFGRANKVGVNSPDLSGAFADPSNPFYRPLREPTAGPAAPPQLPAGPGDVPRRDVTPLPPPPPVVRPPRTGGTVMPREGGPGAPVTELMSRAPDSPIAALQQQGSIPGIAARPVGTIVPGIPDEIARLLLTSRRL